ncbi:MAG: 16S rRNA (guanine(966)-N(2))-methyltransferase RsmD [Desulfuromonadaceae bacterium]|nr:16S rRNA (guanine(966)-N(2))-methyltransferase RsmD [Desulfuromonadaceae bacterium]MDD5106371.1 16S rRNA (guanine(966)-N(2))-methyltransferase RsmD [Desulfuromonadaceae bacterium]
MRVIAGTCRGKSLLSPPGVSTRPTSDRVKESLFNILANRLDLTGIRVLDICAGTGGLGIEALSRGAGFCCFLEADASAGTILKKNILHTGYGEKAEILMMDALKALHIIARRTIDFGLVLFDPPYASALYHQIPDLLASSRIITPDSVVVIECSARSALPESFGRLSRFDRRVYGDTALEFFAVEAL